MIKDIGGNMDSILQKNKECFVCKTTYGLECHHVCYGTANRKQSEKYGLKVWLCHEHHTGGRASVHFNKELDMHLKKLAQRQFEKKVGTREEFRRIFGKSYL
jgi:hypothetical protein